MKIGGETVTTPADDPMFFDLDWRYRSADAAVKAGMRNPLPRDAYVAGWMSVLGGRKTGRAERELYGRVKALHESESTSRMLSALLLTEADFGTLAGDLEGLTAEEVRLYERSFFAVRDEDGQRRPVRLLRMRFREELMRAGDSEWAEIAKAALEGGYALVRSLWPAGAEENARPPAELASAVKGMIERELARRVLGGRMETRDLLRMQQVQIEAERLRLEAQASGAGEDEGWKLAQDILRLVAPKLPQPPDNSKATSEALKNRFAAEKRISAQPSLDRGPAAAAAGMRADLGRLAGGSGAV